MGTWGYRIFEDDASCDWYDEFCLQGQNFDEIEESIEDVIDIEDVLEHDLCCATLVGAEIICAAYGKPSEDFPDEEYHQGDDNEDALPALDFEKVRFNTTEEYTEKAIKAVKKIKKYSKSKLRQLWEEADDFNKWEACLEDLMQRLSQLKV